jgi:hypothetical protein
MTADPWRSAGRAHDATTPHNDATTTAVGWLLEQAASLKKHLRGIFRVVFKPNPVVFLPESEMAAFFLVEAAWLLLYFGHEGRPGGKSRSFELP